MDRIWGTTALRRTSLDIEKDFNTVCSELDLYIKDPKKNPSDIPSDLFHRLDEEFTKADGEYGQHPDPVNHLHLQHNYFFRKAFHSLAENNLTLSLLFMIKALTKLFERHTIKPYQSAFQNMLKNYMVLVIKINEFVPLSNCEVAESEFIELLKGYPQLALTITENSPNPIDGIAEILCNSFKSEIEVVKISYSDRSKSDALLRRMEDFIKVVKSSIVNPEKVESIIHTHRFRIRKKESNAIISFTFFEKNEDKVKSAKTLLAISIGDMVSSSNSALNQFKKFRSKLPGPVQDGQSMLAAFAMSNLDVLHAEFYREMHVNNDVILAWQKLDHIREFLVSQILNGSLDDKQIYGGMKYFRDEITWVSMFTKVALLRQEIQESSMDMETEWMKNALKDIFNILETAEENFVYSSTKLRDYSLRATTSTFAGGFSEFLIHDLCIQVSECCKGKSVKHLDKYGLISQILAAEKCDIILNDTTEPGKADIDIHIGKECAILLKNSRVDPNRLGKIKDEISLCVKAGIKTIFYGVNFLKNIDEITIIKNDLLEIKGAYEGVEIIPLDIKDIVINLLDVLKQSGNKPFAHRHLDDISKVIDY